MTGFDINKIIEERFDSSLQGYQEGLKKSKKGSYFMYDFVAGLYNNCHKVSLKHGGLYIKTPEWLKKHATINP